MPYHLYKGQTLPSRRQIERALKRIIQDQVDQVMHFELKDAHLIGRGVHRAAYLVDFQLNPDPLQFQGKMVLLYPYAEAAPDLKDRLLNEVCVLQSLSLDRPAFRSPYLVGHCIINDAVVILEEWIDGVQIDLRALLALRFFVIRTLSTTLQTSVAVCAVLVRLLALQALLAIE